MSSKWAVRLGVVVSWSFLGLGVAEEKVPGVAEQDFTIRIATVQVNEPVNLRRSQRF